MMNITKTERHNKGHCIDCDSILGRGKWLCDSCMDKDNEKRRNSRRIFRELGLCTICGKYAVPASERICPECRAKKAEVLRRYCENNRQHHNEVSNEAQKIIRENRKKIGLCTKCGKRNADAGHTTCTYCRKRNTQKAIEYRQKKRYEFGKN